MPDSTLGRGLPAFAGSDMGCILSGRRRRLRRSTRTFRDGGDPDAAHPVSLEQLDADPVTVHLHRVTEVRDPAEHGHEVTRDGLVGTLGQLDAGLVLEV